MNTREALRSLVVPALLLFTTHSFAQEICGNSFDDDFDGLTDLNDTIDCDCTFILDTAFVVSSIIPNPSFEDYTCPTCCCPSGISQLNCADTWVQATTPTTDYFNACGYNPPIMPGGWSINGDCCVGGFYAMGWQEYIGGCLLAPLVAGTSYTLSMYVAMTGVDGSVISNSPLVLPATEISIYGSPTCVALPLATTDCPATMGWPIIGTITYNPLFVWQQIQISFIPTVNYDMVIIGPPCGLVAPFDWGSAPGYAPFMFYDDLTLNETSLFNTSFISEIGSWCNNDLQLVAQPDTLTGIYQWYYQGVAIVGQTDTIINISALGLDTGMYQFWFDIAGGGACAYSEYYLAPPVYPEPELTPSATSGCEPFAVLFTNDTDPALIGSSLWDFGDGTPWDTTTNPLHVFADSGTYTITLTVISPQGCVDDTVYTALIHVDAAPLALFSVDTTGGCGPLTVNFTNNTDPAWFGTCSWNIGTGPPINNCADFGYTYTVPGTYPVTLVVTSPGGCPSSAAGPINITVHPDPLVLISSDVPDGCSALAVQFSNDTDPLQTDSVLWDLGDGTITGTDDPSHTYPIPGAYDVSLTVISPYGCTGDTTIAAMITVYGHPVPDFSNDPDSGCYALDVQFTNLTDTASTASCSWTFGDGGTSSDCDPLYTYNTPGVFDVTLTVTSPDGCDGDTTYTQLITVFDHPLADFTMTPQPTNVFQTDILFLDASSSDVVAWAWTFGYFGSLGSSDQQYPGLHFPDQEPGEYPVELIVTNFHGCQDTILKNVVIDPYFQVFVPNSFTPDGDGFNDYFFPVLQDHEPLAYKLYIYDRWGEKVFESTDYTNPWIGTFMNRSGDLLPQGVYVWRLITSPSYDQKVRKEFMGHVSLLK